MSDKKLIYVLIGIPALAIAFCAGFFVGDGHGSSRSPAAAADQAVSAEQFAPFWKTWNLLAQKDVDAASTSVQDRIWGSIQGLADSYNDPYTVFFPPVQAQMFQDDIAGDFQGVGMEIGIKDKQLMVIAPIKDSPAARAGVKTGDAILAIDGTSTDSMSVDEAVQLIRGPKGSSVKITFLPQGASKPVDKTLVRDTINIPTLDASAKPDGIFLISLYSFTAQSPDLFRNALRQFVLSGDHKLILDLRGNPGGYLDAAWDMASWFLPAGKVVVTEDFGPNGPPQVYRSKGYNVFNNNLDMLILVNGGTASAAEILSGALQEQGVAKLVGEKTFGKGVVQELLPITDDTSLKVTVARWLTPDGHNLQHDGLDPDYQVTASSTDIAAGKDLQMQKAVDILKAMP
ncbi:MAG: S41 family peptidase [Patescibacteria group bacterium]|nr:S41 family peptidase [Patescibacteria group bacterium]